MRTAGRVPPSPLHYWRVLVLIHMSSSKSNRIPPRFDAY
jgi:hypothetical protein